MVLTISYYVKKEQIEGDNKLRWLFPFCPIKSTRMKVGIHKTLESDQVGSFGEAHIFSQKSLLHTYPETSTMIGIGHL